ncbi:MAG: thioredoxin family protein [Undibacterium sp.]|nr:thioredoxin family protein [Undibacterium sp.]
MTLISIFLECFVLGMVAFTLPCIFPLAPLTISYFTQQSEREASVLPRALAYAASIVVIYVGLGLLVTLLFGAGALNELASDGFFNVFLFAVLLLFGAVLLGAFELNLPSRWVNGIAAKSELKGGLGIFFMAATLAVVSFSCIGPLIGTILVTVGVQGAHSYLAPSVGMLGFSLALAGIFFGFALFPKALQRLPKSGNWLNSIKVSLGILEIGLAFKFLSTADLAYHWNVLSRELFILIWIGLSLLLCFNLLGKIRFPHDGVVARIGLVRGLFAASSFAFALYLGSGFFGDSLQVLSGFLPPRVETISKLNTAPKKYSDFLHMPHQIDGFFDYEEALTYAKKVHKPLLLDFTGHGCVNCRKMEAEVWSVPAVLALLKEKYVVVSLYTDDKTALPLEEQFDSAILKTRVTTVGKKFKHLQATRFASISQPYYVLQNGAAKLLVTPPIGVELDAQKYQNYLERGLREFISISNENLLSN